MTVYECSDESISIFFDDIPSEQIRTAMKQVRFSWNKNGRFWYAEYSPEREALAKELCGGRPPRSRRSIADVAKSYRHICWYPSAGTDFSMLYYLSRGYYDENNIPLDNGQELPDLFIYTDVSPNEALPNALDYG